MIVDVIIPAHNPGTYLIEALDSVMAQSHKEYTVTVVDDCSTQDIRPIVARYPKARYIRTEKNLGPAGARNLGIKSTQGELISFLDADDVWDPQKLAYSVLEFEKSSSTAMTCGNYCIFANGRMHKPFYKRPPPMDWHSMMKINYVASGSVTIRRSILDKIAGPYGFNERFWIAEDFDLWLRIIENHRAVFLNRILYYYRVNSRDKKSLTQRDDIQARHIQNLKTIKEESQARMNAQNING